MDCESENSIDKLFECAKEKLIPIKSKLVYLSTYEKFCTWQQSKNCSSISEKLLMAYFEEISKTKASSTLWSTYSMLKKTIRQYNNVDIKTYSNLIDLLKVEGKGFQPKKSKVLSADDINKFLTDAPDKKYLSTKVHVINL